MRQTSKLLTKMKDTFLYFAYGSNLLTERIRINNPSAVKMAVANLKFSCRRISRFPFTRTSRCYSVIVHNDNCLNRSSLCIPSYKGYSLSFTMFVERWQGAVATIIPSPKGNVWGVVWEVDKKDLESLDRQEFGYDPITVNVETNGGLTYKCRTYQLEKQMDGDDRPSKVYKSVIIKGAIENGLPNDYVESLLKINDNGYNGPVEVKLSFRG